MKPIAILYRAPQGLQQYLAQRHQNLNWQNFRDQAGTSYHQLRKALVELQHGLCGYCEQKIPSDDSQVEHIIPKSASTNGNDHELDYTNMIACCKGGTAVNLFGPATNQHDPDRVGDVSCGQAKGDTQDTQFLDPRDLPILRSLFSVLPDGQITANPDVCLKAGIPEDRVERTIEILQLKADRLKRARAKRWANINKIYSKDFGNAEVMRQAAQAELLPNADEILPPFFTTNRSYFQHYADSVLGNACSTWI